jgi:hypothetical protein
MGSTLLISIAREATLAMVVANESLEGSLNG